MKAIKISEHVYWVGAIDWGVRNFHGYLTDQGTSYNAFLILADKVTLIDTVKVAFTEELLARIASVIDPQKIDYIISNHSEPDHSGALARVIKKIKPAKVFASILGKQALENYYPNLEIEITPVKHEEVLNLGNLNLKFLETKMIHWPDSMFSYLVEEKLLFSQDAFGMHLASVERFDDELSWSLLEQQSEEYYANIVTPFSPQVSALLKKVQELGLEFNLIAPDHGPVWRNLKNFAKVINLYQKWSARELDKKVVIVYDTMWKSTEKMARQIEDGVRTEGVLVKTLPLYAAERSKVASEMLAASALIVGAPTLNNNLFPSVADVLTYLKGLKFKTPYGAVFGSFGWSGEATKQLKNYLEEMKIEVLGEVKSKYLPTPEEKEVCFNLGLEVAKKIK